MEHRGDSDKGHRNRLQYEKSPYLLQHAGNPVDWYPWGTAAFEAAAGTDKPIFLSIGYSTCHWCHVMERESFEDPQVAAMLNETFICIKVDREERPDIDNIYMAVCQVVTGSGGWPLTILMAPDKTPFYAATYIPKEGRYGRRGLMELVPQVKQLWNTRRAEVLGAGQQHMERLRHFMETPGGDRSGRGNAARGFQELCQPLRQAPRRFRRRPQVSHTPQPELSTAVRETDRGRPQPGHGRTHPQGDATGGHL